MDFKDFLYIYVTNYKCICAQEVPEGYKNRDIDPELAKLGPKEAFAKKEFVILGKVLNTCMLDIYTTGKIEFGNFYTDVFLCSQKMFTMKHVRKFTIITSYFNKPFQEIKELTIDSTIAHIHLIGRLHKSKLNFKIKMDAAYRVQLEVKYFIIPYFDQCADSWMAYQDSDGPSVTTNCKGKGMFGFIMCVAGQGVKDTSQLECNKYLGPDSFREASRCFNKAFDNDLGTRYGRYCGTLAPWTFYSTKNHINVLLSYGNDMHNKNTHGKVNLFYQPFSVNQAALGDRHLVSNFYTMPAIYDDMYQASVEHQQDSLFYVLHLQTLPGFIN